MTQKQPTEHNNAPWGNWRWREGKWIHESAVRIQKTRRAAERQLRRECSEEVESSSEVAVH